MKKTIYIYDSSNNSDPPENLLEFSQWLEELANQIPAEYGEDSFISLTHQYGYGVEVYIGYSREETEHEEKTRELVEERNRDKRVEAERVRYEQLKAKFDPS